MIGQQAKLAAIVLAVLATKLPSAAATDGLSFLTFGIGGFDIVNADEPAAELRLEYRHGDGIWIFKPWLGLEVTSDGAVYGVLGFLSDFAVGWHMVVTPSIGVGAWHRGGGLDLGSVVEFRSQLELAYQFDDDTRLGVAFSHISNAGIGDHNNGAEIATLYYSMPIAFDCLRPFGAGLRRFRSGDRDPPDGAAETLRRGHSLNGPAFAVLDRLIRASAIERSGSGDFSGVQLGELPMN